MSLNKNKNNLYLTPRTHISIPTNNNEHKLNLNLGNQKKVDLVDEGFKRLIFLGKIIKNYFPHKEHLLRRKQQMKNTISNKKLTPFQMYQKNKQLLSLKINSKKNLELKLKTVNSEKNYKNREISNIFNTKNIINLNSNINVSQNKYLNTTACSFNNKFIKSVFERGKNKNRLNNIQYKTISYTESNFNDVNDKKAKTGMKNQIKNKYLLSQENPGDNYIKSFINNLHYEKDKMILLNKQKSLKKKNYINIFNELKIPKNKFYSKTITEENNKMLNNNIPLIDLSNIDLKNYKICNLFIKNSMNNNIFRNRIKLK